MRTCTSCAFSSTCASPCEWAEKKISSDHVSQRELTISKIELIASSEAFAPDNTAFPEFQQLRPVENYILEKFYQDGLSYRRIARKLKKKKSYVKSAISKARIKIGAFSSLVGR